MYFFFLEYFIVGKLIDKLLIVLDVEKVVIDVGWDEEKMFLIKVKIIFVLNEVCVLFLGCYLFVLV